ncbi:MAG: pyrimidine dimer DNA glycosylase/endonuclease V [Chthoniobacterales bacterium]
MRLWTVHPRYLDAKGLVALWREGLLAQKVLAGKTRGYTRHPQLKRFRSHDDPLVAIGTYLSHVADEADRRGYDFDRDRIVCAEGCARLTETRGQLLFEWAHLQAKLRVRASDLCRKNGGVDCPKAHPLFRIVRGSVRQWERAARRAQRLTTERACPSAHQVR